MSAGEAAALVGAARAAAATVGAAKTQQKNSFLHNFAGLLEAGREKILSANRADLEQARNASLPAALIDRLDIGGARLGELAASVRAVANLPDPVGTVGALQSRPAGYSLGRMRVPLGVIGFIYESRPGVTADGAALCVKSGNAVVLRGGSEAARSNLAIASCARSALRACALPEDAVGAVKDASRQTAAGLIAHPDLDLLIPRGGRELVAQVRATAVAPVLSHLDGNCHLYIDKGADRDMALAITLNAKTQRPGVCNAIETLLVHAAEARSFLPAAAHALLGAGVELRCCPQARKIVGADRSLAAAEEDWDAEYLALTLAVKVVADFDGALAHISRHGTQHTDAIVTRNQERAMRFVREVDSSSVIVNASTRFADGFEYGLGAEIGISTGKLHARGPVGLEGLTCEKWVVFGSGQIRR